MDATRDMEQGLRRLFDAGLELALRIQADAMEADSAEARARLASAFHRVSRGVRQTALLQAKLVRDGERAAREARAEAAADRNSRIERRKAAVSKVVERVIEDELDPDDQLDASEDLSVRLETEALADSFLDEAVEDQVARICRLLDLPSPLAGEGVGPSGRTDEGSPAHISGREPDGAHTDRAPRETLRPSASDDHDVVFDAAPPPDRSSSA